MDDDDLRVPGASPSGIAECLRMLADEAASLRLARTLTALLEAIEICRGEASVVAPPSLRLPGADPGEPALMPN